MALVREIVNIRGRDLLVHYSDTNMYIRQLPSGRLYVNAIDALDTTLIYEETDIPLPEGEIGNPFPPEED